MTFCEAPPFPSFPYLLRCTTWKTLSSGGGGNLVEEEGGLYKQWHALMVGWMDVIGIPSRRRAFASATHSFIHDWRPYSARAIAAGGRRRELISRPEIVIVNSLIIL